MAGPFRPLAPLLRNPRHGGTRRLLGAWTALVLVFLYLPIGLVVVYSFNRSQLNILWEGFTVSWYAVVWQNRPLVEALLNSFIIAAVTTGLSSMLGTLAAWLLYRYCFPGSKVLRSLIYFPMVVPEIIMGVSLLLLFGLLHVARGYPTVIAAHVTFCFPFVLIAVQARLAGLDPALEEAAMDLGATPVQAFVRVIVPYLLPAIVAGALMAFTLSIDEFVVTYFTTSAASETLPVKIYGMVKSEVDPSVNALSTLLIVATIVLAIAADLVFRRSTREIR